MASPSPSTVVLRDYQQRDLQELRDGFRTHRSGLLVQPTGAGKGTLASYIVHSAAAKGNNTIFLVNRRTLVHDMSKRLDRLGVDHGIIMANHPRRKPWLTTHIASIDTLHRREPPKANLLIVDEAHFAVSPTWKKVLDKYPDAKVLCMTATPIRVDQRGLGEVCEFMVHGPSVQDLIDQGFLVPSRVFAPSSPDVSKVGKTGGDFNPKQLSAVCDGTKLIGNVVEHWKKLASDRATAVFAVDQQHAHHLQEKFIEAGADFAYVDAKTPDEERDDIWDRLDAGKLQGVCSVGVISYGWDHPIVSCVVLARPTTSLNLHLQQIGRGSRPCAGKADLLVLDHAGNTLRHGFYEDTREWSLASGLVASAAKQSSISVAQCRKCFFTFRAGPPKCPHCAAPMPKHGRRVEEAAGQLEEIQRERKLLAIEEWRDRLTGDKRREKYLELQEMARNKGYKPGWAAFRFKILTGHYPTREERG